MPVKTKTNYEISFHMGKQIRYEFIELLYNRKRTIQAFTLKTLVKVTSVFNKTFEKPPFCTQSTFKGRVCGIILC